MTALVDMCAAGQLRPAVEKHVDLADVATEMDYLATGHARAKIVIGIGETVAPAPLISSSVEA